MEQALTEWGFSDLIDTFKANDIDDEAFVLLTAEIIKELIPSMGTRLKFKKKYDEYLQSLSFVEPIIIDYVSDISEGKASTSSTVTFNGDYSTEHTMKSSSDRSEFQGEEEFIIPIVPKKIKLQSDERPIFENGILQHLQSTFDGKMILKNKDSLTEYFRSKLCKIVIDYLFVKFPTHKIPQSQFQKAAMEIEEAFPKERCSIYFRPYITESKNTPKKQCGGKLWTKYTNMRKVYNYLEAAEKSSTDANENKSVEFTVQENISLDYLQSNCSPWEDICSHWDLSYNQRRHMLKDMELHDYITLFPALKMPEGFHLLVKDFEIMYPSSNKYFDLKWPSIKKGIQILALEKHLWKDGECYNDVIALMLLPLLFPPTTVRSGKRSWRPSKLEVSKSFILQVNNPSEIHQVVEANRKSAQQKKITLQPFTIVCGNTKNLESILVYISLNDNLRLMESVLQAVDVTFKFFFALDMKYPPECAHVWTYIQQYIYEIHSANDISSNSLEVFASELRRVCTL